MSDRVLYFAYGHNTNVGEMHKRIPHARLLGSATLDGYKFDLDHFSNILPDNNANVEGVLWSIRTVDIHKLDIDEDFQKHYTHKRVKVHYGEKTVTALTYIMLNTFRQGKLPTRNYINYIATGYRENKIPLSQLIVGLQDRLKDI